MMKKWITLWILLITVFVGGCLPQEKSVRLQYKHTQGEILKYKVATVSKGTVTLTDMVTPFQRGTLTGIENSGTSSITRQDSTGQDSSPIEINAKTIYMLTQKVVGVNDSGVADIEISYDSFTQDIKIGNPVTEVLPLAEEKPFLDFIEGKKFTIKITKDGSLLGIEGIDKILEEILAQSSQEVHLEDEIIRKFKDDFEKNMINSIEGNYQRLPIEEMKMGDAWIHELNYNIPFLGTTHGKCTYTIEEFTQIKGLECVKIALETTMTLTEKEPDILSQQLLPDASVITSPVNFNGQVCGKGKMIFAYQEGKLINTNLGMNALIQANYKTKIGEEEKTVGVNMTFRTQTSIELQ
ncbi:MAG: DUF6263 family protein [Nitrospirota bacterium]